VGIDYRPRVLYCVKAGTRLAPPNQENEMLYALVPCPFEDCDFEGDGQDEVDEHVAYMASIGDHDHEPFTTV
jgi:hypothetical protein